MAEIRAGGHIIGEHGWEPASLAKPAADEEGPDVSEYHLGGGWYQIGDEKVQGKDAARALLGGAE